MKYTKIDSKISLELNRLKKEPFDSDKCMSHPSYFSHHILGITPYRYQHLILRKFADAYKGTNNRTIVCKSRQIGISICLAILAIWYAGYNKSNNGQGTSIYSNTKVAIVSKSDKQSIKLMKEIQDIIWNSKYNFSELVKKQKGTPLSKSEIHFENGWIKCFPPTDAIRGETADLLIVDEAAFVDSDVFKDAMEPTISAVDGKIILSSTPKGQSGMFFELFDPLNVHNKHEYFRYWFHWQMCENVIQKKLIKEKGVYAKKTGNLKSFEQEYNAMFTVDEEAFFEDAEVEKGIDKNLTEEYEWSETPCCVGVDFGGSRSATAITISTKINNKIRLLFQYAKVNFDENLLMDPEWEHSIPNLMKRYSVETIVIDDCPMSTRTARQLENEGYPVLKYNFRSDTFKGERNRGYYLFRASLKANNIKYPELRHLMREMKTLQEIRMDSGKYMKIKAPVNYRDDLIDSFMMSCYPFLLNDGSFSSTVIDYDSIKKKTSNNENDPRFDKRWEELRCKGNPYDFLFGKGEVK